MKRRVLDVMCGVIIGVGFLGFYACFIEERFDLSDKLFYLLVMISGGSLTMVDLD